MLCSSIGRSTNRLGHPDERSPGSRPSGEHIVRDEKAYRPPTPSAVDGEGLLMRRYGGGRDFLGEGDGRADDEHGGWLEACGTGSRDDRAEGGGDDLLLR